MATHNVTNDAQLNAAFNSAVEGDIISLASGTYASINLTSENYGAGITVTSSDTESPAEILGGELNQCTGMLFLHVNFPFPYASGNTLDTRNVNVLNSTNIEFEYCEFVGADDPSTNAGEGIGLYFDGAINCTATDCLIEGFYRGVVADENATGGVYHCEIRGFRSDGHNFYNVDAWDLEDSYLHDCKMAEASGDHSDFVQIGSSGRSSSAKNVNIKRNVLDIGSGSWCEGIFCRNERAESVGWASGKYENINIDDNILYGGHVEGLVLENVDGFSIQNNVLVQPVINTSAPNHSAVSGNAGLQLPKLRLQGTAANGTFANNFCAGFTNTTGTTSTNNITAQPASYDTYFDDRLETHGQNLWSVKTGTSLTGNASSVMLPEGTGTAGIRTTPSASIGTLTASTITVTGATS